MRGLRAFFARVLWHGASPSCVHRILTIGLIIAAAYLLWAIQRILFEPLSQPENKKLTDLNWRELGLLAPLLACIIWLGVYPAPILLRTQTAAERFVHNVSFGYQQASPAPPRKPIIQPPVRGRGH